MYCQQDLFFSIKSSLTNLILNQVVFESEQKISNFNFLLQVQAIYHYLSKLIIVYQSPYSANHFLEYLKQLAKFNSLKFYHEFFRQIFCGYLCQNLKATINLHLHFDFTFINFKLFAQPISLLVYFTRFTISPTVILQL